MNIESLNKILDRANRFRKRLNLKDGEGTSWTYTFENGETHKYIISGLKPPEEVADDIESGFIWLWSLKDYVKKYALSKGKSKQLVESKINLDPYLCICADIANSSKHGGLDLGSRSGKYPKLGNLKYEVPQQALEKITFRAFEVETDIGKPELVTFEMPVYDEHGKYLGDAFKYLDYALKAWESLVDEIDKAV